MTDLIKFFRLFPSPSTQTDNLTPMVVGFGQMEYTEITDYLGIMKLNCNYGTNVIPNLGTEHSQ